MIIKRWPFRVQRSCTARSRSPVGVPSALLWAELGIVACVPPKLCRADENEHDDIIALVQAATRWLRGTKDTDQWAQPWPSEEDPSKRIRRDLIAGKTWLLRDRGLAVATITVDPQNYPIWPAERQREPAVYVRRLVVSREHAGRRIGSRLLDWAGLTARRGYAARWIGVDAWRTNKELHAYYEREGFRFWGMSSHPDYPSGALFQKPTGQLQALWPPLFREE
jgi:GNAT superfamily N-acetyltransferase